MNRINEAYDRIMNPEKYAARDRRAGAAGGSGAGSSGYGYAGGAAATAKEARVRDRARATSKAAKATARKAPMAGRAASASTTCSASAGPARPSNEPIHPEPSASDSASVRQAVAAINAGDFQQAVGILSAVVSSGRDARWHYLAALANQGAGNTLMALELIRKAVQMDPGNPITSARSGSSSAPAPSTGRKARRRASAWASWTRTLR